MKRLFSLLIITALFFAAPLYAGSVDTMTKDQLKELLGSEDLVIMDVRTGKDWSSSEFKIKDAVRVKGKDLSVAEKYSKGHTFVFYCA